MTDSIPGGICSAGFFAALLIVIGMLAYIVIESRVKLIQAIKDISPDLYRAIIFPHKRLYEADVTSISVLFFYARFRKAIMSRDFHELNRLRSRNARISIYTFVFLVSVICLVIRLNVCE